MIAFKNNSEMVLAVEGARGPPKLKKRNLFYTVFSSAIIPITTQGSKMSQPRIIKTGFKSPPLDSLKGRGPPTGEKRLFFPQNLPQVAIISYSLHG